MSRKNRIERQLKVWRRSFRRAGSLRIFVAILAIVGALAIHLSIARYLANDEPNDGKLYSLLAVNLLEHRVFSAEAEPPFTPTLIRLPGYPLFIAGVYSTFGVDNDAALRAVQAVIHTATCLIVALIAWTWVNGRKRKARTFWSAFGLAALCPFTAIYAATILTETIATFFLASMTYAATRALMARRRRLSIGWWVACGAIAGLSVFFRPDSGLFAFGIGVTLVITGLFMKGQANTPFHSRLPDTFIKGLALSIAFIIPLVPWTIRNHRVFGVFQPLAPAHAEMPGEFVQHGYFLWLRTWIDDQKYIEPLLWNLEEGPITIEQIPNSAFGSADERQRVAALLDLYNRSGTSPASVTEESPDTAPSDEDDAAQDSNDNESGDEAEPAVASDDSEPGSFEITPEMDAAFLQLAKERIARRPLKFYLELPFERALSMWFDTHSRYYPFAGELFPLEKLDRTERQEIWLPEFMALVWIYTLLAFAGAVVLLWSGERFSWHWVLLVAMLGVPRVIYFATLENPEPRYFVELFVLTAILGGIALGRFKTSTAN